MTSFSQLMNTIILQQGCTRLDIPENWMQGRTTYGGLTAALCHRAARALADKDKRLRSAQIAFIGPVGGTVTLEASILREGKSSTFIGVDMRDGDAMAARAIFTFGANRASALNRQDLPMPEAPSPEACFNFFGDQAPGFARHFDARLATGELPFSGSQNNTIGLWLRHKDEAAWAGSTALIALGDAPPPAILSMLSGPAKVSSMTWGIDIIDPDAETEDGWWFARSVAETAADGYSAQSTTIWNRAGMPALASRQTIAVFS